VRPRMREVQSRFTKQEHPVEGPPTRRAFQLLSLPLTEWHINDPDQVTLPEVSVACADPKPCESRLQVRVHRRL
jgi:hypothetical protein